MSADINFVRERQKQLSKREIQDRKILRYSQFFLGGVLLVMMVCLGGVLALRLQLQQVTDRQDELKRLVKLQEDTEKSYIVFVNKLKTLSNLFAQRSDKQEAIRFFNQVFSGLALIREIEYVMSDNSLSFGLRTNSIFEADRVFQALEAPNVKEKYPRINKSELRRNDEGAYEIGITVNLDQ